MNKKIVYVSLGIVLLLVVGFLIYKQTEKKVVLHDFEECAKMPDAIILESYPRTCRASDGTFFVEQVAPTPSVEDKSDVIRVTNPKPNQVIKSPLAISGEVRGTWFFEGSFSGELLDENGKSIANFIAQAQGEWMTSEFVPFKSTLVFEKPATEKGTLVFHKDNPSDMRQFDDQYSIPVRFATPSSDISLNIYFPHAKSDSKDTTCQKVYPVVRTQKPTSAPARAAILELLKGVTAEESQNGFTTTINAGVELQKLTIIEGTAFVDFDNTLQEKVGGSCWVRMIRSQIESTLLQFPTVKSVVISINGNTEDILQP